jgi:hypothetical protein
MRHVELLNAKESRDGFEAVACERRALQAHGWNPPVNDAAF